MIRRQTAGLVGLKARSSPGRLGPDGHSRRRLLGTTMSGSSPRWTTGATPLSTSCALFSSWERQPRRADPCPVPVDADCDETDAQGAALSRAQRGPNIESRRAEDKALPWSFLRCARRGLEHISFRIHPWPLNPTTCKASNRGGRPSPAFGGRALWWFDSTLSLDSGFDPENVRHVDLPVQTDFDDPNGRKRVA
jgi:hypothetical protein